MADRPSAILIGDSICMGYRPLVKQRLADKVEILGIAGNGGDSGNILSNIDQWMVNRNANLIHFNCGLHDLKFERDTKKYQQPIDVYEENLKEIVSILKARWKGKLAWATTTPVIDARHNAVKPFDRYQAKVEAYNKVAISIMKEAGIPIDDLHSVIMKDDLEACLVDDGVHMTGRGNMLLAEAVSNFILSNH
ncbi:SGNH/GDSL hydrolase family protein [Candidatus Poribacteria bacterium]|nr:SGNH/GDSL hydrolase family protein [Candidatus Poribacteria bacterium]